MLRFCINCRKDLEADALKGYMFCYNCRTTLTPQQVTERVQEVRKKNAGANASKFKGNRKRKAIVVSKKVHTKTVKSIIKRFHGPRPDGDEPNSSITAFHGGLPGLGKHH